jgi:hypothetical protein
MKIASWLDVERTFRLLEDRINRFTGGIIAFDPSKYYTRNEIDKKISTSIEEGDIDSFLQGGNVLHFLTHVFKRGLTAVSALIETTLTVNGATDLDSTLNVDGAADFNSTVNVDAGATFNSGVTLTAATASRPLKVDGSKVITSDKINLASTNDVTGTLPVANGGTGSLSFTAGAILVGNGTSAIQELSAGVSGQLQLTVNQTTIFYLDHASAPQSLLVVTSVSLTANNFTDGIRTT